MEKGAAYTRVNTVYEAPCFSDRHFEKIIIVAIFVNFLQTFKVEKFGTFSSHLRATGRMGSSFL